MRFKQLASEKGDGARDTSELEMGVKVEKEHSDVLDLFKKKLAEADVEMPVSDDEFFEMIARAHLRELRDYYTRLKKMESEAKS